MNERIIEMQIQEAVVFAITQRVKNLTYKRHNRVMKETNGVAISNKALKIIRNKHRLEGRDWSNPIGIVIPKEEAKISREIKPKSKLDYYTENDLITKFGRILYATPDPEILKQILDMKKRGL